MTPGPIDRTAGQRIERALLEILRMDEALATFKEGPASLGQHYGLSEHEARAVARPDIGALYRAGIHPYILAQFALTIGFDMSEYGRQVRAVEGGKD